MQPVNLVLVEDMPMEAEIAIRQLEASGFTCNWKRVETEEDLKRALADARPDLVLSDFTLPGFDGISALEVVREMTPDIPFIFLSGTIGEERAIDALQRGAHDYVLKTNLARLAPAVARGMREVEERRARRKAEALLQQAQKMEAIGLLAGGVAHDFNNLLGIITGYCGLILGDLGPGDPQRPRVQEVAKAAERGATLTRQLLAFGRKQVLQPKVFDLKVNGVGYAASGGKVDAKLQGILEGYKAQIIEGKIKVSDRP